MSATDARKATLQSAKMHRKCFPPFLSSITGKGFSVVEALELGASSEMRVREDFLADVARLLDFEINLHLTQIQTVSRGK